MRTELEKLVDSEKLTEEQKRVRRVEEAGVIRTPNQSKALATARLRTAIAELVEANITEVQQWLDFVAFDDPAKAIDLLLRMLEFSVPKLSRVEASIRDNDGVGIEDLTIGDLQKIIAEHRPPIIGEAEEVEEGEFEDLV